MLTALRLGVCVPKAETSMAKVLSLRQRRRRGHRVKKKRKILWNCCSESLSLPQSGWDKLLSKFNLKTLRGYLALAAILVGRECIYISTHSKQIVVDDDTNSLFRSVIKKKECKNEFGSPNVGFAFYTSSFYFFYHSVHVRSNKRQWMH